MQLLPTSRWVQARELKSVYVSADARFLKMVILGHHVNDYNKFNQVSIIAVSVVGTPLPDAVRGDMSSMPPGVWH